MTGVAGDVYPAQPCPPAAPPAAGGADGRSRWRGGGGDRGSTCGCGQRAGAGLGRRTGAVDVVSVGFVGVVQWWLGLVVGSGEHAGHRGGQGTAVEGFRVEDLCDWPPLASSCQHLCLRCWRCLAAAAARHVLQCTGRSSITCCEMNRDEQQQQQHLSKSAQAGALH